jgi:predicted small secreted protein
MVVSMVWGTGRGDGWYGEDGVRCCDILGRELTQLDVMMMIMMMMMMMGPPTFDLLREREREVVIPRHHQADDEGPEDGVHSQHSRGLMGKSDNRQTSITNNPLESSHCSTTSSIAHRYFCIQSLWVSKAPVRPLTQAEMKISMKDMASRKLVRVCMLILYTFLTACRHTTMSGGGQDPLVMMHLMMMQRLSYAHLLCILRGLSTKIHTARTISSMKGHVDPRTLTHTGRTTRSMKTA